MQEQDSSRGVNWERRLAFASLWRGNEPKAEALGRAAVVLALPVKYVRDKVAQRILVAVQDAAREGRALSPYLASDLLGIPHDAILEEMERVQVDAFGVYLKRVVDGLRERLLRRTDGDLQKAIPVLEQLATIAEGAPVLTGDTLKQAALRAIRETRDRLASGERYPEFPVKALVVGCGPLEPGNVSVVYTPTGGGKTSLASQTALHNARNGLHVVWVTTEEPIGMIAPRLVVLEQGRRGEKPISVQKMRGWDGQVLSTAELERAQEAILEAPGLDNLALVPAGDRQMRIEDIVASIRLAAASIGGLENGLVVLDYLGQIVGRGYEHRAYDLAEYITRLRNLANSLSCHVLVMEQGGEMTGEEWWRRGLGYASRGVQHRAQLVLALKPERVVGADFWPVKAYIVKNNLGPVGWLEQVTESIPPEYRPMGLVYDPRYMAFRST